jgi:L-aspartate oxidase
MNPLFDDRRYLIPFRSILLPQIFTDTLIIGAGVGGLAAAQTAAKHGDVIVISKGPVSASNSSWAQGGVAAAMDVDDTVEAHVHDTLIAGAGLCDEDAVRTILSRAPATMARLLAAGFRADEGPDGKPLLGIEGGHGVRRILHADGDATGRELVRCLLSLVRGSQQVRLFQECFALDLITPPDSGGAGASGGPCLGAITWHKRYGLQVIWAKATILSSGGAGVLWRETTNPTVATADGIAMAYRAGAALADLAFMQFHPTTLYVAGSSRTLISEAVRGEGAHLVNHTGHRFMSDLHPMGELAPRDIVARAIFDQLALHGIPNVWLDARPVRDFAARFPGIAQALAQFDIDPAKDLIPVNPAAHYMVGGARTDLDGRTTVPGLYAVGEAACTGLHGANRLASNSLIEAIVMGEIAGTAAEEMRRPDASANGWGVAARNGPVQVISTIPDSDHGELDTADVRSSIRSTMWRNVGLDRSGAHLRDVCDMFDFWARYTLDKVFDEPHGWELQNMLLAGALVARSAAWRAESRGCHRRRDAMEPREDLTVHDLWSRGQSAPRLEPVSAPKP